MLGREINHVLQGLAIVLTGAIFYALLRRCNDPDGRSEETASSIVREIMYRQLLILCLFVATTIHAAELDILERRALLRHVVGNTIHIQGGEEHIFQYLDPSGAIREESTAHGKSEARWRFFDDRTLCFESADPMASGCVGVHVEGSRISFVRRDGVIEGPFELLPGNPRHL